MRESIQTVTNTFEKFSIVSRAIRHNYFGWISAVPTYGVIVFRYARIYFFAIYYVDTQFARWKIGRIIWRWIFHQFSWRVSANDGTIGKSFQIFDRKGSSRYIKENCEVRLLSQISKKNYFAL